MGEYAELYTLQEFGVDISAPEKRVWKWACPICKKRLHSEFSQTQHLRDKHKQGGRNGNDVQT